MTKDPRTTEALPGSAPHHVLVRECRLTIVGGEHAGRTHAFAAERLVIGAVLAVSLVTLGLQAIVLRPRLWPAGGGIRSAKRLK